MVQNPSVIQSFRIWFIINVPWISTAIRQVLVKKSSFPLEIQEIEEVEKNNQGAKGTELELFSVRSS